MKIVKALENYSKNENDTVIFLAGSCSGTNKNWRNEVIKFLENIENDKTLSLDNLVIIDDSIVRGTTLKQSILSILDRLNPKKIVIVSSSPQIRYPDFYGIDMESMDQFVAFKAAMELLQERGLWNKVIDTYNACKEQLALPITQMENKVKNVYTPFSEKEISQKIVELLLPKNIKSEVEIVFQPIEGLHKACPNHLGDWYFTGNYPTPGGVKRVNMAFIDYYENYNK